MQRLDVTLIQRDMLLQPRAELHRDWIEEYAHDMAQGAEFPPVVVYHDGRRYWLADGFHRLYAAEAAGLAAINAEVRRGDRRDALLHALSANAGHGHRRTNEDKRRAVDIMLADPEWSKLPDLKIAAVCLVTHPFVAKRRQRHAPAEDVAELEYCNDYSEPEPQQTDLVDYLADHSDHSELRDSDQADQADQANQIAATPVEPFDWDAAEMRRSAMDAIRALAKLPAPTDVLDAWMKSNSYGEPIETLSAALAWLAEFVPLYRRHEPARWSRVQEIAREDQLHAAE